MTGNSFLADTNSFIYLLNNHPALKPILDSQRHHTFVTEIELLGKQGLNNSEDRILRQLLNTSIKLTFSESETEIAINLRRKYKIKIPDAIIASSAIHHGLPLITFDKDFPNKGNRSFAS